MSLNRTCNKCTIDNYICNPNKNYCNGYNKHGFNEKYILRDNKHLNGTLFPEGYDQDTVVRLCAIDSTKQIGYFIRLGKVGQPSSSTRIDLRYSYLILQFSEISNIFIVEPVLPQPIHPN